MSDKFSFYQTEGLWGIIENASDEKQTSIKSYFGSDLIIKRLNEQAEQIDQLKQQLTEKQNTIDEINKEFVQTVHDWKTLCAEKDKEIERLKVFEKAYYFNQLQASQEDIQQFQQLANQSAVNINYIAIQELEKVKDWLNEPFDEDGCFKIGGDLIDFIDQQINDLRGEKDAEG